MVPYQVIISMYLAECRGRRKRLTFANCSGEHSRLGRKRKKGLARPVPSSLMTLDLHLRHDESRAAGYLVKFEHRRSGVQIKASLVSVCGGVSQVDKSVIIS